MPETAVKYLVEKYKLDEMKASAIIAFYETYTDQEIATVPGQLTAEELLYLQQQQQQQQLGQPFQVSVPQQFGAGGVRPPAPAPEGPKGPIEKFGEWYGEVWPWGALQVWNFLTDPLWLALMTSGYAGYTGARAYGAGSAGIPYRAATPSGKLVGRITKGVPTSQLIAARQSPEFAQKLANWYEQGRVGPQPRMTPAEVRQARYLASTQGQNILKRVTGPKLRFPQSAISLLTESEIMAAESNPAIAQRFRAWFNTGASAATKPIIPVRSGSWAGTTFSRLTPATQGIFSPRGIPQVRIAPSIPGTPSPYITARATWPTTTGIRTPGVSNLPQIGPWPETTGIRTPGQSNLPGQTYRNLLRTRGQTGGKVGAGLNIPAAGATPGFWSRALGGLVSGLSLIGTIEAFKNVGAYFGAPTGVPGSGEIPEPKPFQWGPGTEKGGELGKCATGHSYHTGFRNTITPGCYSNTEIKRINKAIQEIELQENLGFGPSL